MIRRLICERFTQFGFEICAEAENGIEAIKKAALFQPDLITLDLSMPVMNGLEAAPELKRLLPHTRIILFTQFGHAMQEAQVRAMGIDALVSKSDSIDLLVKKAQMFLGPMEDSASGDV
jgi:two-component system chemotaxis response regulator CheY